MVIFKIFSFIATLISGSGSANEVALVGCSDKEYVLLVHTDLFEDLNELESIFKHDIPATDDINIRFFADVTNHKAVTLIILRSEVCGEPKSIYNIIYDIINMIDKINKINKIIKCLTDLIKMLIQINNFLMRILSRRARKDSRVHGGKFYSQNILFMDIASIVIVPPGRTGQSSLVRITIRLQGTIFHN